jgi:hypothetical protein
MTAVFLRSFASLRSSEALESFEIKFFPDLGCDFAFGDREGLLLISEDFASRWHFRCPDFYVSPALHSPLCSLHAAHRLDACLPQ